MIKIGLEKMHHILESFSQSNAVDIVTWRNVCFTFLSAFRQIFRKSTLQNLFAQRYANIKEMNPMDDNAYRWFVIIRDNVIKFVF